MFVKVEDGQIVKGPVPVHKAKCRSISVCPSTTAEEIAGDGWLPYELKDTQPTSKQVALEPVLNITADKVVEVRGVEAKPALDICYAHAQHGTTHAWTAGITEQFDETTHGTFRHTGAFDTFAAEQSGLTVTCDPDGSPGSQRMGLVSFGPA